MALALTALLAIHGAIHLLGFLKWSRLAAVDPLGGRALVPLSPAGEHLFAAGWLIALALLLAAAGLRIARHQDWWPVALAGAILSQALVVLAWPDAKAGTVANILIVVAALMAAAHARFVSLVDSEARGLIAQAHADTSVVARAELDALPAPVSRWLAASGVVGRPRAATVRLRQQGEMRTRPDAAWMPVEAQQYFSVDPPAFVWRVDATMMHALPIAGRDRYAGGHGQMLIKAGALVNVVNADDDKIALGSMLRYLGEIIWFPSAALSPGVSWQAIDETHARATMRDAGLTATAFFTFDEEGRVRHFGAMRYLGAGKDAKLTPWVASCSEWRDFEGIRVPTRGEVGWELSAGTFIYYRWQILDVQYNRPDLYPSRPAPRSEPQPPRSASAVASHAGGGP